MAGRRLLALALLVLCFSIAVTIEWLRSGQLGEAFLTALVLLGVGLVAGPLGTKLAVHEERKTIAQGYLDVGVRSPDGHSRFGPRWRRAEIRPTDGQVRISPLAASSAVPLTIEATAVKPAESPLGKREQVRAAFRRPSVVLEFADQQAIVQVLVPQPHVEWLLDAIGGSGDQGCPGIGRPASGPAAEPHGHDA